jgi:hypothetical protein
MKKHQEAKALNDKSCWGSYSWKNDLQMIETLASSDAAVAKTFGQSGIYCWWGKDNWHSRSGLA